ncbi:MAG: acyl-CoA dehydrogenase, partial [Salinibacterium sp.]|nr:acyl-CoA dehydrogenase [Salinibacterium sp.]
MTHVDERTTVATGAASISPASANTTAAASNSTTAPVIDNVWLGEYLLGTWAEARKQSRALMGRPEMHRIDGLSMEAHRERVLGLTDESAGVLGGSRTVM